MKVLVTGGKGQVGSELKNNPFMKNNSDWLFSDRRTFDISDLDNINFFLDKFNPDVIINCAAYTLVDRAESDFKLANTVNHKAIGLIAKWSYNNNCKLLHVSTDYVYDGNSIYPYVETDQPNPLNNYGKSKLLGDLVCQKYNPNTIIIRTSWLYSSYGNNFLTKMIKVMHDNKDVFVVNDQFGSPTYAADLANTIILIIRYKKWQPGIFNYTSSGKISRFNFAKHIKSIYGFNTNIISISSKDFNSKTIRPKYSVLDNSKIINTFNITPIDYLFSLKKCIKIIQNES